MVVGHFQCRICSNMSAEMLRAEQIERYYETMPEIVGVHTGSGSLFSYLPLDLQRFPFQAVDVSFIHPGEYSELEGLPLMENIGRFMITNLDQLVTGMTTTGLSILEAITVAKAQGHNVILAGNHPEFDSIAYASAIPALAHVALGGIDNPMERLIPVATGVKHYGLGENPVALLLANLAQTAFTAPGTERGKKIDEEIRDWINARTVAGIDQRLADPARPIEITMAYEGQTGRSRHIPGNGDLLFQYSASNGTLEFLCRPDVLTIPFATHKDKATRHMTLTFGTPRHIQDTDDSTALAKAAELGNEIAFLSYMASGSLVWQAPNPALWRKAIGERHIEPLKEYAAQAWHNVRRYREHETYDHIVIGQQKAT